MWHLALASRALTRLQRRRQRRDLIRQKLFLKLLGSFCRRSGADSFLPVSALPRSFHGHEATSRLRTCTQRAQRAARSRDLCARPGRGCQPGALHCVLAPLPRGLEGPPCCPQGLAHPGSRGRHPNTPEMEAGSLPSPAGPDACTARSLGMRSGPFPAPASHGAKEPFHRLILSGNGPGQLAGALPHWLSAESVVVWAGEPAQRRRHWGCCFSGKAS